MLPHLSKNHDFPLFFGMEARASQALSKNLGIQAKTGNSLLWSTPLEAMGLFG